jgi:DNA-binding NtrC family response regulator
VRELENLVHRAVVLTRGPVLSTSDFPLLGRLRQEDRATPTGFVERVAEFERALIMEALAQANGVQTHAARALGISERHLRYKLKKMQTE